MAGFNGSHTYAMDLALIHARCTLGDYRAFFVPTRPGTYTFHFTGAIKRQQVDLRITSGETTFDDIKDSNEAQFPAKDPSNADLDTRIKQEFPRVDANIAAAKKN